MLKNKSSHKFKTKLFLTCLLISLIPTLILGSFCYYKMQELLIERERIALRQSISRETSTISSQLKSYSTITEHIIWDNTLTHMLRGTYQKNSEMFSAYKKQVEPFFQTIKYLYQEIEDIILYTDLSIYPRSNVLEPLDQISHHSWFSEVCQNRTPVWICSNRELAVAQRFVNTPKDITAIIYMTLDIETVFANLNNIYSQSYGVVCADSFGSPIWEYHAFDLKDKVCLSSEQLTSGLDVTSKQYIVEAIQDPYTGWNYYIYRPTQVVLEPAESIVATIFTLVLLCLVFVFAFSSYFSRYLVEPLEKLAHNMNLVSQGNYQVHVVCRSNDEVGQLIVVFTDMVQKLNELINEKLLSKITQQKLELRALQSQINPHFLYNTLSLINSQALMSGHAEIGLPARYLATFYRTSLNKGNDLTLIKNEIENIKAYINIQLIMHANSFEVIYNIPENLVNYTMPNLMLQPLVENAIVHGFDESETPKHFQLVVSLKENNDQLLFSISDNGRGIDPCILSDILTKRSGGYGVENVHARAQLQYGHDFGVSYHSRLNEGTEAILTIPKVKADMDKPTT